MSTPERSLGSTAKAAWPPNAVEDYVESLKDELAGECVIVLLQPWKGGGGGSGSEVPCHVHVPGPSGQHDQACIDAILKAGKDSKSILVPTMFNTPEDRNAATSLIAQLPSEDVCAVAAVLLEPGAELTRAQSKTLLGRHDELVALGFDDVILNPDTSDPASMKRIMRHCRVSVEMMRRRTQQRLDAEPAIDDMQLKALRHRRDKILLEDIPKTLMPKFPVQDPNLRESQQLIGDYRILRRLPLKGGIFVLAEANEGEGECVMIKAIDKSAVADAHDLEGIYREQRFLSDLVKHPYIAECIGALHSPHRVYLIFKYAGEQSLSDFLADQPGERLPVEDAITHFDQLADALEYCHHMAISIRNVSLDRILMCRSSLEEGFRCKFMSFSSAAVVNGTGLQRNYTGTLPFMPPEACMLQEHNPFCADCWSIGVVLLEMAGGLGSLARSVPVDMREDPPIVGHQLMHFFSSATSHRRALARLGGVQDEEIEGILRQLLRPEPPDRATMKQIVAGRASIVREPPGEEPGTSSAPR